MVDIFKISVDFLSTLYELGESRFEDETINKVNVVEVCKLIK